MSSSQKSRYNLRSGVADAGTVSTRTRSSGSVKIAKELPARKRARRVVKSEPSSPGVVVKVEQRPERRNVETTAEPSVKVEPEPSSSTSSTLKNESPPASPVSSSRSSSPFVLKAEPRESSPSSVSSLSSLPSISSLSSSCSSYHLPSSPPSPPPRREERTMNSWSNSTSVCNAPSGSTAKVWDTQNGQLVVRELPLVQEKPRYEREERSVSPYTRPYYRKPYYKRPYYKKPYYKKPYQPYWKRNNRGRGGRGGTRWDCRCAGSSCSNCGAVTGYRRNDKPMNIHCDITVNAPSTHRPSSVYIEELTDEEGSSSSRTENPKRTHAVALPSSHYSHSTPVVVPVPVPVMMVPQPAQYQPSHVSFSYMGYNVSCSTRFR